MPPSIPLSGLFRFLRCLINEMKSAARLGSGVGIVPGALLAPVRLDLWYNQTARCVMTRVPIG